MCHTHRTWSAARVALSQAVPAIFSPDCVNLVCLPLFHVAGFNMFCFTLVSGGRAVLLRRTIPQEIAALLEEASVTFVLLVPALIAAILALPARAARFANVRTLAYGASPIPQDVLGRAHRSSPATSSTFTA